MSDSQTTRIERDSMGDMPVPAWALWGASTQRAVLNFPISGRPMPAEFIHAYGVLKAACARVNRDLGLLPADMADAIIAAAEEIAAGKLDAHFPVDIYQTGSGTSTNMNVNEVIANRVNQMRGLTMGSREFVHPNDHVNLGQSSNDTSPTAMQVAAAQAIQHGLMPALTRVHRALGDKAREWDGIIKIGRTHLMDATPIRMGQVFAGYAGQLENALVKAMWACDEMRMELPIGGTAVGTGINTHPEFGRRVCESLTRSVGGLDEARGSAEIWFTESSSHVAGQAAKDQVVQASGNVKTIAVSLGKIANDIRLLAGGPRGGIGELVLPAIQPGSSIMPGKVNPVICESVIQVCCRVIGNDATITMAASGGVGSIFELNTAMPVMADAMLESIRLLANAADVFREKVIDGLEVNRARCEELVERSLMMVTALAPVIGYDAAAKLAKEAHEKNLTIRELVRAKGLIDDAKLDELLDPRKMTGPGL